MQDNNQENRPLPNPEPDNFLTPPPAVREVITHLATKLGVANLYSDNDKEETDDEYAARTFDVPPRD